MPDDLAALDATASADLVRRGEVSAAELVEAAKARIQRLDPQLNAVVRTRFEEAAAEVGSVAGPFAGVPFLLKDLGALVAGERTDFGSGVLKNSDNRWSVTSYTSSAFARAGGARTARDPGVRHDHHHGADGLRADPQPLGPVPLRRGVERRCGGGRRLGDGPGRARQRRWWLDPDPRELLRARRSPAESGA